MTKGFIIEAMSVLFEEGIGPVAEADEIRAAQKIDKAANFMILVAEKSGECPPFIAV